MRFKPITLSAVLVIALCGARQPAEAPAETPGEATAASPVDAAFTPSEAAPSETPTAPADGDAPPAEPSLDAAALQTPDSLAAPVEAAPSAGSTVAAASTQAEVPADKPAVPAKGKPPTREYFVGVWAEQGKSCETALDFKADGTLIGPFPRWELSDEGELTMTGNRQKIFLTVLDANTMQSRRAPTDPPRVLKRCGR
jgi:hypothetical protein